MSVLFGIPVDLAYHLVCWLAPSAPPLLGGLAAAAAIVAFTMLIRLVLLPLSYYAFRGERARSRLLPQVQELQRRHARDPERLQRELAALYRAEGTSMFAGCLPLLLQIPFFCRDVPAVPVPLGGRGAEHAARAPACWPRRWAAGGWPGPGPFSAARRGVRGPVRAAGRGRRAAPCGPPGPPRRTQRRRRRPGAGGGGRPGPRTGRPAVAALSRLMPFGSLVMAAIVPLAAGPVPADDRGLDAGRAGGAAPPPRSLGRRAWPGCPGAAAPALSPARPSPRQKTNWAGLPAAGKIGLMQVTEQFTVAAARAISSPVAAA